MSDEPTKRLPSFETEVLARLDQLAERMDRFERRLGTSTAPLDENFASLKQQITDLDKKIDGVESRLDAKIDKVAYDLKMMLFEVNRNMQESFLHQNYRMAKIEERMDAIEGKPPRVV